MTESALNIDLVALTSLVPSIYGLIGETPVLELSKALQKRGHHVRVLVLETGPPHEVIGGVEIRRCISTYRLQSRSEIINNLEGIGAGLRFFVNYLESKADLFHIRINPIPFLFKEIMPRKFIYDVGNMYTLQLDEFHRYSTETYQTAAPLKVERIAEIKAYKAARMIIAITRSMKDTIVEKFGVEDDRVEVISDGVNTSLFKPKGPPPDEPVIVYEGSIAPFRGIETLLESLAIVRKRVKNAKLLIVGGCDRPYYQELLEKIRRMGFDSSDVELTGYVPYETVPDWLARAQVGVSPIPPLETYRMSTPMKVLEYMAMNIPVVATEEIDFHKEVVGDRCGILVKSGAEDMSDAILRLLEDRDTAIRMGKAGREVVESRFTWQHIAEKFEQVYTKAFA